MLITLSKRAQFESFLNGKCRRQLINDIKRTFVLENNLSMMRSQLPFNAPFSLVKMNHFGQLWLHVIGSSPFGKVFQSNGIN